MATVLFQLQSIIIVTLFYVGFFKRKERSLHMKLMSTAMIWDLLLVLQIELSRSAVATAVKVMDNSLILNIHVGLATSTIFLYLFMVISGFKLKKGGAGESVRSWHRIFGVITLIVRTLTIITSFFIN